MGSDSIMREPSRMRSVPLWNKPQKAGLPPSAIWRHSQNTCIYEPGAGLHQTQILLAPWSWTSQPPEMWEINLCCSQAIRSMVFFFLNNSQNRLRHYPSCSLQTISSFSWISYRHVKISACPKSIHYFHLFLLLYLSPTNLAAQPENLGIMFSSHSYT